MSDEKHGYERAPSPPPIPTYEEATSSRNTSARLGPNEISDDAERQGLLNPDVHIQSDPRRRNGYYQAPSVQSVEDEDSLLGSPVRESQDEDLRQTMEEMEILDPESIEEGRSRRNRSLGRLSKRFYSITHTLSSFHLPRIRWPSWRPDFTFVTQRLPTIPDEYKPGWSIIARLFGLILIVTLVYLLVVSEVVPMGGGFGQPFNAEWVRQTALQSVESWRIEKNLEYITSYDHIGGTEGSYVLGQWIEGKFKDSHMDTYTHDEYYVYMNFAKKGGRKVAIVDPPQKAWEAQLEEPSVFNPPKPQTPAYHGLSASGNATGPLIYVNYCDKKDFKRLWDSNVDVKGAVALCRYHGTQPDLAMKVKAAQEAGVAGVLVYSDPADDGFKKGNPWPDGKWRPGDSVQRGSVAQTNMIMGDVLTPGKSSAKKQERISKDNNPALPKIPSLPLSWKDAQKLLQSLKGSGEQLPDDWVGGVPDVGDKWFSGHPDTSPKVYLQNYQDEVEQQRITNVFGSIKGSEDPGRKIIIGNHRDSWCFGAADPGSGTAIMLEVMRVLGLLRAQGWHPLRTIEFASWDGGEDNRIGSTEYVEANADTLREGAIAYLNVDIGVTGDKLWASGSPIFQHAWSRVLDRLTDPHENKTLKELWENHDGRIDNPNAASDDVPFLSIAGTSSMNFGFTSDSKDSHASNPMTGSCYETLNWMAKYVDPDFQYHHLLAQIWILLILELAQEPIMPMKIEDYARALQEEGQKLLDWTETTASGYDIEIFQPLVDSLSMFKKKADDFHKWETYWYNQVYATGGFETQAVTLQRVLHNAKISRFESDLLDLPRGKDDHSEHGLPGRDQYKHAIFAPSANNALEAAVFPFARDAIEKKDWDAAAKMIKKTADILNRAAEGLRGG
ncbi:Zn-dependent exopeptidase [Cucurbitaria berberidis CBS 394.84]|uniref:Zn-dependent exopeptidase n=1 Tax=Cucurbitaria berberidis CBS 394.84 TaxID=1168544 RepID=A0A9P4GBC5_9PLEO|nr:Zn-dependent exopeptidase [Cucurbitaria berberidis CBS 394.84]KAF1842399.1 Zn-dependent exopeptidase [Cucurbitaria berberidis CBS 394.84]